MGYFGSEATSGLREPLIVMMPPHETYIETHIGGRSDDERRCGWPATEPDGSLTALGGQTLAGSGFMMCGRFTQQMTWKEIRTLYRMPERTTPVNLRPRYNGCPTQDFATVRLDEAGRAIAKLRWGLIPAWAKDVKVGARMIDARAETVHEKPAFRAALRRRRCLIPADGWLEWRKEGSGKQPWFITAASGEPLSFAGLWDRWEKGDEPIETFTILATAASAGLIAIHHRQPTIIEPDDFDEWLAPDTLAERRLALARSAYEGPFSRWPVSRRVNNGRNDEPELLLPLDG